MFRVVREVFSERNIVVLSTTSWLYRVFNSLWQLWWSLYVIEELNAPIAIVGLLSTVQNTSQIIFQLPGGILADKIGRRRVIVLGTTLRIVGPFAMLLAPTWQWVVPGVIINAVASLYMPAFNAIIAESLPHDRRGTAFGAYRMVVSIPLIVMPILSGLYIDAMGVGRGVRLGLSMYVVVAIIATLVRALFLKETLVQDGAAGIRSGVEWEAFSLEVRATLRKFRGTVLVMLVVACISGFSMRMVYPFLVVYGVDVIGLKKAQWGALQTIAMGLSTSLYLLGGMVSDRFGRVPCILLARSILPMESLGLLFIHDFNQLVVLFTVLGVGGGLGGGSIRGGGYMGGPAWQALIADTVPQRDRGKIMGLMATVTGFINLPAPIFGAYLWENGGPNALIGFGGVLGLSVIPLALLFIKEPETRHR